MIYGNLARVNQIDSQIDDLHEHLSNLYAERRRLMQSKLPVASQPAAPLASTSADTGELYQTLSLRWKSLGLKLPVLKSLRSRLEAAQQLANKLEAENNLLVGTTSVVIVPPQKLLKQALRQSADQLQLGFAEAEREQPLPTSRRWQVIVVINRQLPVNSNNFSQFMANKEYQYDGLDCRALGLAEFLAAGLQTGNWPADGQWLLLLKNQLADQVLCVIKHHRQLTVDVDSTDALLGRNYFQPAILVEQPSSARPAKALAKEAK